MASIEDLQNGLEDMVGLTQRLSTAVPDCEDKEFDLSCVIKLVQEKAEELFDMACEI